MQDDYEMANFDESNLPKHLFMTPKQKKKHFKKLNNDYRRNLRNGGDKPGIKKLKFDFKSNKIKSKIRL